MSQIFIVLKNCRRTSLYAVHFCPVRFWHASIPYYVIYGQPLIVSMTQGNLMIVREERTFSTCTSLDDVTPWCYTRTRVIITMIYKIRHCLELVFQFSCAGRSWITWWLLGLLLPQLFRGVALACQQVQPNCVAGFLEPCAFRSLNLGIRNLLHIWPSSWGEHPKYEKI